MASNKAPLPAATRAAVREWARLTDQSFPTAGVVATCPAHGPAGPMDLRRFTAWADEHYGHPAGPACPVTGPSGLPCIAGSAGHLDDHSGTVTW